MTTRRRAERILDVLIALVCIGLVACFLIYVLHIASRYYILATYSEPMRGYFAIEIINETDISYEVILRDDDENKILKSLMIDPQGRATIISSPASNRYLITFRDSSHNTFERSIYVSSLPYYRYEMKIGDQKAISIESIELYFPDFFTMNRYLELITEMKRTSPATGATSPAQ